MRPVKEKKCKQCGEPFLPFTTMANVCSIPCAIKFSDAKREKQRKTETRKMRREFNEKDKTYQLKRAQEAFNAFIRERDKGQPCISCGTTDPALCYDAGHYRTTGAHPELRFEEDNCFRQCHYNCNINRSGNIVDYRIGLLARIGAERLEWLEGNHEPKNYTLADIIEIKLRYRAKAKELRLIAEAI